ncbi:MAG: hypothetical protein KatS3mg105_0172 [Gemmatales bacterium]|nr:MAG: hypothetical protein KatS3mg105_0172 [Gemmatales bacterium]
MPAFPMRIASVCVFFFGGLVAGPLYGSELKIRADFAGGSVRVEHIDQQKRRLRISPFPHLNRGFVCWWYFKVEGIRPGEILTLDVGEGVWATPDQAVFSTDNKTWSQTSPGKRAGKRIIYQQKVDASEAWFAWGPPYTLSHANAAVKEASKRCVQARAFTLCRSKDGHAVPALVVAPMSPEKKPFGIWVNARQHAWEAGSSWVCQGFIDWLVSKDPDAVWLRDHATVIVVPIMDVDNVERGAGGKNQKPHDHNRDWSDNPVWPEVAAAISRIKKLKDGGSFDLFVDLHNPAANDRSPFFFVPATELMSVEQRQNLDLFLQSARKEITGPLKLASFVSKETGANYDRNWRKISCNWVVAHTGAVAACLETSWNTKNSTMENYRTVGEQLGKAMVRYLQTQARK